MKLDEWLPDWNPVGAGKFHKDLQKAEISSGQIPLLTGVWAWHRSKTGEKSDFALETIEEADSIYRKD